MHENECIFCQIVNRKREALIIYEDEYTMAFADLFPLMRGHTLVIPKRHFSNIYELDLESAGYVFKTTTKIAKKIKELLRPDGINIHQTNERAAGQEVYHLHIHIIPRYIGKRLFIMNVERKMADQRELIEIFTPLINELRDSQ
ncbi:MAG: HIT family protein [Candidatus Omnitrophica bacterium]|nr:HIT family protein [Candidatus Omnitrophota bacterium]